MKLSPTGKDLLKHLEGIRLESYQDGAGVWTIGYGTTRYPNGSPVKAGQKIPEWKADELLDSDVSSFERFVFALLPDIAQNKFDAAVILCYNIGKAAFRSSTALRLMQSNPGDPQIKDAFLMWTKITVNGKKVSSPGLVNRRMKEIDLYFSAVLHGTSINQDTKIP